MHGFRFGSLLASAVALQLSTASALFASNSTPAYEACEQLRTLFPNATLFGNTTQYNDVNTDFWSQASALGPACIFAPSCAEDMGRAVRILKRVQSPFAIRGGGHMPIGDSNNINSTGVLLSSTGLKRLELEADGQSVHIGPANHWGDVYRYLEPSGKVVVGGRLGIVGVPGFVTGGGTSFFSARYGWASNNVKSYTVVLADGSVVKATPGNSYADLFWALRGGGNSYGFVTDLELKTYDHPTVTLGLINYVNTTTKREFYEGVVDFTILGQAMDPDAATIPLVNTGNIPPYTLGEEKFSNYLFWAGNATANFTSGIPPSLEYFTSPKLNYTDSVPFVPKTMNEWSEETLPTLQGALGFRARFYTPLSLRVIDRERAIQALDILHNTYFDGIADELSGIKVWFTGMSPFPLSKRYLAQSADKKNSHSGLNIPKGDPMGLPVEDVIVVEISITYTNDAIYDPIIDEFTQKIGPKIRENIRAAGLGDLISPYLYLNDADKGQDVFGGYPKKNVRALQRIRAKYDPERVFTDLAPGGWKVADVKV